ncbi:MAG: hypothetical protein Q4A79_03140 [Candidatus Saccharibacteria bacterium]|nr:hypothetical protein [Candidatus Saccharibacteria bacterium]
MIQIFYGNDRLRATAEIQKCLGKSYEIFDGEKLTPSDLPNIFLGASLFSEKRAILIRDFTENKAIFAELPKYLNTPHSVILFETKLDKRSALYKEIKDKVDIKEFNLPEKQNFRLALNVFSTAKTDGKKAIALLEQIEQDEDPIMFLGLLTSQALKDLSSHQTKKEIKTLKELARIDLLAKTTSVEPWLLIKSFLLSLSTIGA